MVRAGHGRLAESAWIPCIADKQHRASETTQPPKRPTVCDDHRHKLYLLASRRDDDAPPCLLPVQRVRGSS